MIENILENKYDIKNNKAKDEFCFSIIKVIKGEHKSKVIDRKSRQFLLNNKILFYELYTYTSTLSPVIVIPQALVQNILKSYHDSPTERTQGSHVLFIK